MKKFKKRAFTLIELSIVLVIIGIILASVMKGRDLIGSASSKEVSQTFIQNWATIANTYFSKTAQVMGDGTENGGTATSPDGFFDDIGGSVSTTASWGKNFVEKLKEAGIDPCGLIKSEVKDAATDVCSSGFNPFKRNLSGEFVGKLTSNVHFYKMTLDSKVLNVIIFTNVPGDLAKAIDTIIDGIADGTSGSVVGFDEKDFSSTFTATYPDTGTAPTATTAWQATNGSGTYYYYSLGYIIDN